MDFDSLALVLVDANENQDDIIADQKKVSHESPIKENELLQQLPQETPLMPNYTNTPDQVVDAVPLSYRLPDKPNNSTLKEKNGSPSGKSIPKPRKTNQAKGEKYNANWHCEIRQRSDGKLDKYYYHKKEGFMCRSLKEVERFEIEGIRPTRKAKAKQKESTEETIKEMNASEIEQISFAKTMTEAEQMSSFAKERGEAEQKMITVETFLADARYNLDHFFDNQQHQ